MKWVLAGRRKRIRVGDVLIADMVLLEGAVQVQGSGVVV